MARRHVVQYYLEIENQYFEMLKLLPEVTKLLKENKITQEDYNNVAQEIEPIKANYEFMAYIMLLLNKPNKKDKKEDEITQSWYKALHEKSKEVLIDQNKDVLCKIKELIMKGQL